MGGTYLSVMLIVVLLNLLSLTVTNIYVLSGEVYKIDFFGNGKHGVLWFSLCK